MTYEDGTLVRGATRGNGVRGEDVTANIRTIAEFVETAEVLDVLGEIGVDFAQGHASDRPVPIASYFAAPARGFWQ